MPKIEMSRIAKFVDPYRITRGKGFRLKDHDPGDTAGLKEEKKQAREILAGRRRDARRPAGQALRAGPLGRPPDLPGDGRRRQGRHDQARHVGREPAGLPGLLVQGAVGRGAGPRLPLADDECLPERGRIGIFNRSYYEEVLVVRVHPELLAEQRAARRGSSRRRSGRSASRTSTLRAAPRAQRHGRPEVLPERLARRSRSARFLERARHAGQELEVLCRRRRRSASTGSDYMAAYEDMIRHTATP